MRASEKMVLGWKDEWPDRKDGDLWLSHCSCWFVQFAWKPSSVTQYLPQFGSNREAFKIRLLARLSCKNEKVNKRSYHLWPDISLSLAETERRSRLGCLQDSVAKVKLSSVIQSSASVWFQLLPVANVIWVKYRFQGTFYCPICNLANMIWVKSETWRKTLKQYHLWPGEVGPSNCPQSLVHSLWSLILFWNCNNFQDK